MKGKTQSSFIIISEKKAGNIENHEHAIFSLSKILKKILFIYPLLSSIVILYLFYVRTHSKKKEALESTIIAFSNMEN